MRVKNIQAIGWVNCYPQLLKKKTLPIREARFCEYTEYIYRLMINLEHEYRNIEGKNKTLLSYINDKRTVKLEENLKWLSILYH